MRYNQLGRTGLFVSEMCLGTMTFGGVGGNWVHIGNLKQQEVDGILRTALGAGINFIDTADVYSFGVSETLLGQALKNLEVPRADVVIATKVYGKMGEGANARGASRAHIMNGVRASLDRLGTDHIDLYQIHGTDPVTPIEETLRALDDLVRQGLVRYVGVSNWGGLADRQGARPFGAARPGADRQPASLLHHRRPRPGARDRPAAARGGGGPDGLEPAGRRAAERQVRAGQQWAGGVAARHLRLPAGEP